MTQISTTGRIQLRPEDILAGLACADRSLLAASLALFDDSTLERRVGRLLDKVRDRFMRDERPDVADMARKAGERIEYWKSSAFADDELRLLLWIQLREAFALAPRLSTSWRGCKQLADDLTAALLNGLKPEPGRVKALYRKLRKAPDAPALNLDDIVLPVLDELISAAMQDGENGLAPEVREAMLQGVMAQLSQLDGEKQQALLEELGIDSLNDAALRKVLLTGGGLSALSAAVGMGGFSAYILVAQASAFIPLIGGPGLVSLVAVLADPVTMVVVTGGVLLGANNSASRQIRMAVAARIVALLAIQGLQAGRDALAGLPFSFARIAMLKGETGLSARKLHDYRQEWELISQRLPPGRYDAALLRRACRSVSAPAGEESANAAWLAAMTVGDVLYSAASIDPHVIQAADFLYSSDIEGALDFAELAQRLMSGSAASLAGGISQLKGYVAEQLVATQLIAAGHVVSLPDAANQAGWDLLVDGQPFQVKFHASLAGLREHFERYDYPVIANSEMVGKIPAEWADKVFFVDGLSNELVEGITRQALDAGADLLAPTVPVMALLLSTCRGLLAYRAGQISAGQMVEQVLLDGFVRAGLAGAGHLVGTGVGLLVLGPAGAWILGSGAPILAQSLTSVVTDRIRRLATDKQWCTDAHASLDVLVAHLDRLLLDKQAQLSDKRCQLSGEGRTADYLDWRLRDEQSFVGEIRQRLAVLKHDQGLLPTERLAQLLRWLAMSGVHPAGYQPQLQAVSRIMQAHPTLWATFKHGYQRADSPTGKAHG